MITLSAKPDFDRDGNLKGLSLLLSDGEYEQRIDISSNPGLVYTLRLRDREEPTNIQRVTMLEAAKRLTGQNQEEDFKVVRPFEHGLHHENQLDAEDQLDCRREIKLSELYFM